MSVRRGRHGAQREGGIQIAAGIRQQLQDLLPAAPSAHVPRDQLHRPHRVQRAAHPDRQCFLRPGQSHVPSAVNQHHQIQLPALSQNRDAPGIVQVHARIGRMELNARRPGHFKPLQLPLPVPAGRVHGAEGAHPASGVPAVDLQHKVVQMRHLLGVSRHGLRDGQIHPGPRLAGAQACLRPVRIERRMAVALHFPQSRLRDFCRKQMGKRRRYI